MLRKRAVQREFEAQALPHLDALHRTAVRLCGNERDADDLVQDAMLRAFRFFHRFERGTNCKAWLFKILQNSFNNRYHRQVREREVVRTVETRDRYEEFLSPESAHVQDPEQALLGHMLSGDVRRALDAVPAEFRSAVLLSDVEGFSYKEIADIMECPIGTVMSRLYRGRHLLRRTLYQYAVEAGIVPPRVEARAAAEAEGGAEAAAAAGGTVDLAAYRRRRDGVG